MLRDCCPSRVYSSWQPSVLAALRSSTSWRGDRDPQGRSTLSGPPARNYGAGPPLLCAAAGETTASSAVTPAPGGTWRLALRTGAVRRRSSSMFRRYGMQAPSPSICVPLKHVWPSQAGFCLRLYNKGTVFKRKMWILEETTETRETLPKLRKK